MLGKRLCLSLLRPILRAKTVTVGNLAGDLGGGGGSGGYLWLSMNSVVGQESKTRVSIGVSP